MIVCVTDHCNLAFSNKCTFVGKKNKKGGSRHDASASRLLSRFKIFNCVLLYSETAKGHQQRSRRAAADTRPGDTRCVGIYIPPGRERERERGSTQKVRRQSCYFITWPTVAHWSILPLFPFHIGNTWTHLGCSSSEHSDPSSDLARQLSHSSNMKTVSSILPSSR